MRLRARTAFLALILLFLATAAGISIRKVIEQERAWSATLMERDPQFLHCKRMQVAASQAALDALALTNAPADAELQAEYQHERRQLQADWMGIEQLAARDPQRQGLLLEIRASQSNFMAALDQATTSATLPPSTPSTDRATPLLVALQRAQRALSNYSGSLEQDAARTTAAPAAAWVNGIWISLMLLFVGCAAMVVAWESTCRKCEEETERHRQQGMLCHSAEAALFAFDTKDRVMAANPSARILLGLPLQSLPFEATLARVLAPGEYDRLHARFHLPLVEDATQGPSQTSVAAWLLANSTTSLREIELQFLSADGKPRWMLCNFSPLQDAAGEVSGVTCAALDIHARHEAAVALSTSEEHYRNLCEHTREMLAVLDSLGRYQYVNAACLETFGNPREQMLGASFESVFPLDQQVTAAALLRKVTHGQQEAQRTLKLRRQDGSELELEAALVLKKKENALSGVQVIFRDVTARNNRERRLAMQAEIGSILARAVSIETLLPELLQALAQYVGADFADFWSVSGQPPRLRSDCQYSRSLSVAGQPFRSASRGAVALGEGIPGRVLATHTCVWIEDVARERALPAREEMETHSILSAWGVPVYADNQLLAVVQFYHRRIRKPDMELADSVEQQCKQVGQYMVRIAEQAAMQRIQQQSNSILHAVADGVFVVDVEGRITFANPAATQFLGLSTVMLQGRPLHATLHADIDHPCKGECLLQRAMQRNEDVTADDVFTRADGSEISVHFSLTSMIEQETKVGSVLSFHVNRSQRVEDTPALSFFSALVAEFRAPLEKMRAPLLRRASQEAAMPDAEAKGALDEAFSGISQMLQLIHACTELGQLASSEDSGAMSICDLHALAQQIVEALQPLARAAQVQLQLQATPVSIAANGSQIRQVLQLVLYRAIHVSPPASTLQIVFDDSAEALQIHVIDQGREAASKALLHCLEGAFPDSQTPTLADLNAIAQSLGNKLLRRYGGSLWATRNAEQGLTVHLRLPH